MTTKINHECDVHAEEMDRSVPAVTHDRDLGWLCEECAKDVGKTRGDDRTYAAGYAYAAGYRA